MSALSKHTFGLSQELRDLMRGLAGGMIFGSPVLYTMEVWFEGTTFSYALLFFILFAILLLNIFVSYFAGLREHHSSARFLYAIDDGVTSIGLSLFISCFILVLIGRIDFSGNPQAELGKVLLEACIISVGVTFTNFKFGSGSKRGRDLVQVSNFFGSPSKKQASKDLNDLMAAIAGSCLFSFNVAPTEEIIRIAAGLSYKQLICLLLAEIFLCFIVLYASGIKEHVTYEKDSFFQKPLNEVLLTTSVAVIVSGTFLLTIGYGDMRWSDSLFIPSVIVLSLPAVVGGAAGRLVV